jgi:hypothetical protein
MTLDLPRSATPVRIDARFNGPPDSANGGYACGAVARLAHGHLDGQVAVTLLAPIPIDSPLHYEAAQRRGHVFAGTDLVATASVTRDDVPVVPFVDPDRAGEASTRFPGHTGHPFPTCFACGTERGDDGLRLFPGPLPGDDTAVACLWTPGRDVADDGGTVGPEVTSSVLDCPGGWTEDARLRPRVLGRLVTVLERAPHVGRTYVVVARAERQENQGDRTVVRTTALYDAADASLVGRASAIWIALAA